MILVFFEYHAIGRLDLMRCNMSALIPIEHKDYDKNYFLTDCGGHQFFAEYSGLKIEERLVKALEMAKLDQEMNVLDLGCGRGEVVLHCALRKTKVCGIDFSKDALDLAKHLINSYPHFTMDAYLIRADVKKIPLKNNLFDRIFLLDIIEHLHDYELNEMFQNIYTLLKEDGLIIIHTTPNKWYYKYGYQIIRMVIFLFERVIIKKDIRSCYEKKMHVNEQSTKKIHKILKKHRLKCKMYFSDHAHANFLIQKHIRNRKIKYPFCSLIESQFLQMLFCNSIYVVAGKTLNIVNLDHIKSVIENFEYIEALYTPTSIHDTIADILNDHIVMGVNDVGNLGKGWHHLENWPPTPSIGIRWTSKKAIAYLKNDGRGKSVKIFFFTNADLEMKVFINGRLIKKEKTEKEVWQTFEGEIDDDELLQVKIELDKTWIPDEIFHNRDKRKLGIAVEKIWIE